MSRKAHVSSSRRRRRSRYGPPGQAPGTLIAEPGAPRPLMRLMAFGPQGLVERQIERAEEAREFLGKWPVTWVHVEGLGDTETIAQMGQVFGLHPLALEDVVSRGQRAKLEDYGAHLFLVAQAPGGENATDCRELGFFLGKNFLATFAEQAGDCFEPVRDRARHGMGRIREAGPDYLAYALIDAVVDHYFPAVETYEERLEEIEDQILTEPRKETIARLHQVKRELRAVRRALWPMQNALERLMHEAPSLVREDTRLYLRDVHDNIFRLIEWLDTFHEIGTELMNLYMSNVSNRMNEVMKVLTIVATIFIPLTFLAGLYGMNFNTDRSPWNMPELNWPLGYPMILTAMAATVAGMLLFFRRRRWL